MLISKLKAKHDELANSKLPPAEVAKLLQKGALLLDVRTKLEARKGVAPGATHISLFTLKRRMDELPRNRDIVLYCARVAGPRWRDNSLNLKASRRSTEAVTRTL